MKECPRVNGVHVVDINREESDAPHGSLLLVCAKKKKKKKKKKKNDDNNQLII